MIVLIDNYDSFTYNLYQDIETLGHRCTVVRNDAVTVSELAALRPTRIVISPGPGTPIDAAICTDVVRQLGGAIPILGICLGHQVIAHAFGGEVVRGARPVHGKTAPVFHDGTGIYRNVPSPFIAVRYHSLVVRRETLPPCLEVTSETNDHIVMGVRHRELPIEGVQFHPESIATDHGLVLLDNFIAGVLAHA